MNALKYDGGSIGNHEFNYGLGFLGQVTGSRFQVAGIDQPQALRRPGLPARAGQRLQRENEEAAVRAVPHHRKEGERAGCERPRDHGDW